MKPKPPRRPCPRCGDPQEHAHIDDDEATPIAILDRRTTQVPVPLPMQETKVFPIVNEKEEP